MTQWPRDSNPEYTICRNNDAKDFFGKLSCSAMPKAEAEFLKVFGVNR